MEDWGLSVGDHESSMTIIGSRAGVANRVFNTCGFVVVHH